jgi:putative heme degradation protein
MRSISAVLVISSALLTSCAGNWVSVDGSRADAAAVAEASDACKVAEKTQMLKNTRKFTQLMTAKTSAEAEQLNQAYDTFAQRVNADIANCMRSQGLIAS